MDPGEHGTSNWYDRHGADQIGERDAEANVISNLHVDWKGLLVSRRSLPMSPSNAAGTKRKRSKPELRLHPIKRSRLRVEDSGDHLTTSCEGHSQSAAAMSPDHFPQLPRCSSEEPGPTPPSVKSTTPWDRAALMVETKSKIQQLLKLQKFEAEDIVNTLAEDMGLLDISVRKRAIIDGIPERPLNGGGFADIYQGQLGHRRVAIKRPRVHVDLRSSRTHERMHKALCKEASIWKSIRHPNVLEFIGVSRIVFPDTLCLVSPWLAHGHIEGYLKEHPEANRPKFLVDIAAGLKCLHRLGITHGDLKSRNILVDDHLRAQLVDFGLASITSDSGLEVSATLHLAGSTRWMAPELLRSGQVSNEADIYTFAMVAWELFAGRIPFAECSRDAVVINKILNGDRPARPPDALRMGLTDILWELMERSWRPEAEMRPTAREVHPAMEQVMRSFVQVRIEIVPPPESFQDDEEDEEIPDELFSDFEDSYT